MNYRSKVINDKLKDTNRDIMKNSAIIVGCAAITMASAYGTIVLSQELLEFYNSGETLTLQSRFLGEWEEAKIGFAMIPGFVSGIGAVNKLKTLKENFQYKKSLKKELKNINNK